MTKEQLEMVGRLLAVVTILTIDITAGYLIGHHFHSFIIGYVTYAVLAGLDTVVMKLVNILEVLKGAH